jgi:hypothetical protein
MSFDSTTDHSGDPASQPPSTPNEKPASPDEPGEDGGPGGPQPDTKEPAVPPAPPNTSGDQFVRSAGWAMPITNPSSAQTDTID